MKKVFHKGKKFIVLATVLTLIAGPVFLGKGPSATTTSLGDVWLIGGW